MQDGNPLDGEVPNRYEDAHFVDAQARAIYDAYLMLRDAGYEQEEVKPLGRVIDEATIFEEEDAEWLYTELIKKIEVPQTGL